MTRAQRHTRSECVVTTDEVCYSRGSGPHARRRSLVSARSLCLYPSSRPLFRSVFESLLQLAIDSNSFAHIRVFVCVEPFRPAHSRVLALVPLYLYLFMPPFVSLDPRVDCDSHSLVRSRTRVSRRPLSHQSTSAYSAAPTIRNSFSVFDLGGPLRHADRPAVDADSPALEVVCRPHSICPPVYSVERTHTTLNYRSCIARPAISVPCTRHSQESPSRIGSLCFLSDPQDKGSHRATLDRDSTASRPCRQMNVTLTFGMSLPYPYTQFMQSCVNSCRILIRMYPLYIPLFDRSSDRIPPRGDPSHILTDNHFCRFAELSGPHSSSPFLRRHVYL